MAAPHNPPRTSLLRVHASDYVGGMERGTYITKLVVLQQLFELRQKHISFDGPGFVNNKLTRFGGKSNINFVGTVLRPVLS